MVFCVEVFEWRMHVLFFSTNYDAKALTSALRVNRGVLKQNASRVGWLSCGARVIDTFVTRK